MLAPVVQPRSVRLVAAGCGALTVVGNFIGPGDVWGVTALVNLVFILATIGVSAFIVSRNGMGMGRAALGGAAFHFTLPIQPETIQALEQLPLPA